MENDSLSSKIIYVHRINASVEQEQQCTICVASLSIYIRIACALLISRSLQSAPKVLKYSMQEGIAESTFRIVGNFRMVLFSKISKMVKHFRKYFFRIAR